MMSLFRGLAACIPLAALSACGPTTVRMASQFNPSEVAFINSPGTGTVTGQAFMRQRGGGVVTCAGNEASLTPVTRYSSERMQVLYGNTERGVFSVYARSIPETPPAEYLSNTLRATCDAQGNFHFENVPGGTYYLIATVRWVVPSGYIELPQGGGLMQKVTIAPGQTRRVVMAD